MPRDLSTYRTRLSSPLPSSVLTRSQVSTSDVICSSPSVGRAREFRLVKSAVTPLAFRKSTWRVSIAATSAPVPMRRRSDTGSITTTDGSNSPTSFCMANRCASRPSRVGRAQRNRSSPASTHCSRRMPTEAMLRTISAWDSSNAKYIARSPRRHAASQNWAASVDLPVPALPLMRTVLPL